MRVEPPEERVRVKGELILVLAACAGVAACGPAPAARQVAAQASAQLAAYLPPPAVASAERRGQAVQLSGSASPGATIRLASPDGSAINGTADARGSWRLSVPIGERPRLYSLSETSAGRLVRALGYLAVLPAPGPAAAMLHPAASASVPPAAGAARGLAAIDYDASGTAMASGRASPGESVRLSLDGREAGEDRAHASGEFSASLTRPLTPDTHALGLTGQRLHASVAFAAPRAAQVATPPFDAQRLDGAWRIDWITPAGGVQSTLLFDPRGGRS